MADGLVVSQLHVELFEQAAASLALVGLHRLRNAVGDDGDGESEGAADSLAGAGTGGGVGEGAPSLSSAWLPPSLDGGEPASSSSTATC